ncbi:MAG TPA: mechanosensitive ion channel family protein, partial [Thermoplasmataceae archaeon]|nr:mechanosensitive ion channel family protein [Thermoplasmataceae archaeon]
RAKEFKKSIMVVIRGPVPVVVLGIVLVIVGRIHPHLFPDYLSEGTIIFIFELVLLLVSINAARKISTIVIRDFFNIRNGGRRLLLLGIYSIGLIALFYIIFTSPISPIIAASAFQVVSFITGLILTYIIVYIINLIILRYQSTIKGKQPQLHTTITFGRRVLIGIIALVGAAAAGFSAFPSASGAIASLFVAAGFTSIVIGLAAQSSLSNLIAGGVVSIAQPFRIGDAIIFDSNYCFVEDIKLIFTVLRTWDGRRLMVPNNMFLNTIVVNYNAVDETKLAVIYMQITLESDLDKAMEIMKDVIRKHPLFYPTEGMPSVLVMDYTEYGVQLRALGRARNQNDNWTLEKESLYNIKKEFDKNGIKIAVPRREVVFRDGTSKIGPDDKGKPGN